MVTSSDNILQHLSQCPLCSTEYRGARVSVVEQRDSRVLFHIMCPSCKANMLFAVRQGQMGAMYVGSVTDLTAQELGRLADAQIHPNAVLDLYTELRHYRGSLTSALRAQAKVSRKMQ